MAQAKKTYDFKSVGKLQSKFDQEQQEFVAQTPIGILTPVSFNSYGGSLFQMSHSLEDQIRDNLKNLLSTNHGERMMLTDFGANLKELAYELTSEDVISEAIFRISTAVGKYMPFVSLETLEPSTSAGEDGVSIISTIRVGYSVPIAGAKNQFVEVSMVVTS